MYHILLVCNAGMSTSMLVQKMQGSAKKKGIEADIRAVGMSDIKSAATEADIILLGPQVKYMENRLREQVNGTKKIMPIDMMTYGRMDGEKILEQALDALKES